MDIQQRKEFIKRLIENPPNFDKDNFGKSGVYALVCRPTLDAYVGRSINMHARIWSNHLPSARYQKHPSLRFQEAWELHGELAFVACILEVCDMTDEVAFRAREQHWLDELHPSLNMTWRASKSNSRERSPETNAKIAASKVGVPRDDTTKKRLSSALTGRKQTPEHVEAMRQGLLNMPEEVKAKWKENLSRVSTGRVLGPQSEERKAKMVATRLANGTYGPGSRPKEATEAAAAKNRGKKRTPEQKERMRQAALNRKVQND